MPQVRLASGQLSSHQIEHAVRVDADVGVSAADSKQRACRLRSDVGQGIFNRAQQSIDDDLRSADRKHSGQPSSYDWRSRRIEQRVEERTRVSVGDELQGPHGVRGNSTILEQWDHVRQDRGVNRIARVEHTPNAVRIPRLQCHDLQHVGVGATQIRSCGLLLHRPTLGDLDGPSNVYRRRAAFASSRV